MSNEEIDGILGAVTWFERHQPGFASLTEEEVSSILGDFDEELLEGEGF